MALDIQTVTKIKNSMLDTAFLNTLPDDLLVSIYNQVVAYQQSAKVAALQNIIDKATADIATIQAMTVIKTQSLGAPASTG